MIDLVRDDHAVVDRSEPSGHDDSNTPRVVKSFDLLGQCAGDRQSLELGAEACSGDVLGVMVEGTRRSGFDPLNFFSAIRDVLFQSVECRLDEILFARLVCLLVQIRPVAPIGIGARYNGMPLLAVWSSTWVVETKGSRGDVSIQKQVLKLLSELQKKYNLAYLIISHDLAVIRAMSHELMVLRDGEVVEYGETEAMVRHPKEPYTKALFKAAEMT